MTKETIKTFLIGVLVVYSIFATHFFVTNDLWIEYKECGTVVGSSSEDRPIKHGTQTELYLLMEYDNDGFQAQEVGATTYFKYKDKVGIRLCFERSKRNPIIDDSVFMAVYFCSGCASLCIYLFFILWIFIWYLSDDE